jgi:hypothetical protein
MTTSSPTSELAPRESAESCRLGLGKGRPACAKRPAQQRLLDAPHAVEELTELAHIDGRRPILPDGAAPLLDERQRRIVPRAARGSPSVGAGYGDMAHLRVWSGLAQAIL